MQTACAFDEAIFVGSNFGDVVVGTNRHRAERPRMRISNALVIHRHVKETCGAERLACGIDLFQMPTKRFFARPVASGFVRAGLPEAITDDEPDAVTLDDYLIERPSQTVLIRVKGDSMQDAGILEGDLVVVEKAASAKRGDIVVAVVDNQFTLKRLDVERGQFVLKPENKAYEVIRPEGTLEIFGVMVGLVRKL